MTDFPALHCEDYSWKSEDFSKKSLENHSFTNCSFQNCNFSEAHLPNTRFCLCTFSGCNLSLVNLEKTRFQDVKFLDCKIVGADFFKCEKMFFSPSFINSLLHYCNFSDLEMKNVVFSNCQIKECNFKNTSLSGAQFNQSDLSGTIFHNCDLSKSDFTTASHYDIDPRTNNIKKARFSFPEAVGLLRAFDILIT